MANSAVFAAMQIANVSSTVAANPFARHKDRTAYFRSSKNASMTRHPFAAKNAGLWSAAALLPPFLSDSHDLEFGEAQQSAQATPAPIFSIRKRRAKSSNVSPYSIS
jgi:hypothetical protein